MFLLFDLDGTLTESRKKIDQQMISTLKKLVSQEEE